jgi:type VI secretion system protein ImpH
MANADWPAADAVAAAGIAGSDIAVPAVPTQTSASPPQTGSGQTGSGQISLVAAAVAPEGLFARLAARPSDFSFYQAMRLLEAQYPDRPRLGRSVRPSQDALRLAQEPSTIFAPSTLAAFEAGQQAEPGKEAQPDRLLVHFFGLFGPDGPLPLYLTDYARDRRRNARDPSFQRFADIFHHRALSLFYRAWADVRPTVAFDRPAQDRFATYLGALTGLGMDSLRDRDAMPDLTKLHFAGRLANQTRHAEGLAAILSAFFTMPVRIESFIGAWLTMPAKDRTALGSSQETGVLGASVLIGSRVWSRQHKFRVVFGPLDLPDYLRLLPGGLSFHRLIPIVRNYVGDTLMWDVNIVLKREAVPPTLLGRQGRLGWTSWLMPRPRLADAADLFLDASADSFARKEHEATSHTGGHDAGQAPGSVMGAPVSFPHVPPSHTEAAA